jgi:hypothetical protein
MVNGESRILVPDSHFGTMDTRWRSPPKNKIEDLLDSR